MGLCNFSIAMIWFTNLLIDVECAELIDFLVQQTRVAH